MKIPRTAPLAAMALLLSACGGSDAGSSGVTVVSAPAASPVANAPTPTPTPTPAPTPAAPTTNAAYGSACDGFASDQRAYAISSAINLTRSFQGRTTPDTYIYSLTDPEIDNFASGLSFTYAAATRAASTTQYSAGTADATIYAFGASDVTTSSQTAISYRRGYRTLDLGCPSGSYVSTQVYGLDLANPSVDVLTAQYRAQLTGQVTMTPAEVGSGAYASTLSLVAFRTDVTDPVLRAEPIGTTSPGTLAYDASRGAVTGTLQVGGSAPFSASVSLQTVSGTTRFDGTIVGSDGTKGTIAGGFYGPGGRQVAYVTTFEKFGVHYAGWGTGTRN